MPANLDLDAWEERRRAALVQLDHKIAGLRAELALITPDDYAAMQPHEQRLVDSARRAVEAYDRDGALQQHGEQDWL